MSDEAERLYERARSLPRDARAAFVREACRGDPELRDELLSLLEQAEAAEGFFGLLDDAVLTGSFWSGGAGGPPISAGSEASSGTPALPGSRELPPGHTVDRYRILEQIGIGGMGTVYRARDMQLARDVALKFLPPSLALDDDSKERLLSEARAAAALEHPNVCTVHEIGETEEGQAFIAMAFYDGETLKERLRRGPLPVSKATEVAVQLAHGLAAAHARGIVHRDVKPGNVMLTATGTVKLLDFGLAKRADAPVTGPGATLGTVAYMSPEQVRGGPLDRRTDLWSLGVVLYEMLSGVRPFRGGNNRVLLRAILHGDPDPVTERRPETPEPLARVVERLLRKEAEARYASAEELRADLEREVTPEDGISGVAAATRRGRTLVATGITAVLVALVAGLLWLPGRGEEQAPAAALRTAEPSIAVLPFTHLSPDGRDAPLADGMTEELVEILATVPGLRVVPSSSAFASEGPEADLRAVADSLRVANVLVGSLDRSGSRLRVQVRLADGRDGSTRWSQTYDREAEDVFAVQDEITRAVARELDLSPGEGTGPDLRPHQTSNVAAYELYLRGSDQSLFRSDSGVRRGVQYFKEAIALDSTYAAAHAGLAVMYMVLSGRGDPGTPVHELEILADRAASKAVALDDSLADAHAAFGMVRQYIDYDFASAERALKRAITLDPTRTRYRTWLAQLYIQTARPREALREARRALEIDPLSPTAHAELAHALLANGQHDEALARLQRIADLHPPLLRAAIYSAQAYARKGMWPEAVAALRPQAEEGDSQTLALYGYVLARGGQRGEAVRVRATLLDRWREGSSRAFDVAVVDAGLGDFERAFTWLDRSIDDGSAIRGSLHVMSPILEELRSDPRFEPLAGRLAVRSDC